MLPSRICSTTKETIHAHRSLIAIGIVGVFAASLFASTVAFAAQGQITEVNPSGVHGRITVINNAGTESEIAFTFPPPMQPEGWAPEVGDEVEFTSGLRWQFAALLRYWRFGAGGDFRG